MTNMTGRYLNELAYIHMYASFAASNTVDFQDYFRETVMLLQYSTIAVKLKVFVRGKNTILKFVGNTK